MAFEGSIARNPAVHRSVSLPMADGSHAQPQTMGAEVDRRAFLKLAGFAFGAAALSGCARTPIQKALPYLSPPEGILPGRTYEYAAVCGGCAAGCGVLVQNRDGRPIKLEGNPGHPLSGGGLCATGQASILGLYDRLRLKAPLHQGQETNWNAADSAIRAQLEDLRKQNKPIRILTGTRVGPTGRSAIQKFLSQFANGRHVLHGSDSASAIAEAYARTHGSRVLPHYLLDKAEVLVGLDADFLGTWISPVEFARGYQAKRDLEIEGAPPHLSLHVQFESQFSLTGSKADRRFAVAVGQTGLILTELAARLSKKSGAELAELKPGQSSAVPAKLLEELSEQLWQARGKALVLSGNQDVSEQVLCNYINHILGSYGATIDLDAPSHQNETDDRALAELLKELNDGQVGALVLYQSNPAYDLPSANSLAQALRRLPLLISCGERLDETAELANYVCPVPHYLETWDDSEPVEGIIGVSQPAIRAFGETRPFIETLAAWSGQSRSAYDQLREYWESAIYPRRLSQASFALFWDSAVHDGYVRVKPRSTLIKEFNAAAVRPVSPEEKTPSAEYGLVLYHKVGVRDGSQAYNPWLQELPDPVSKVTWDNYASISPDAASRLGVSDGDMVRLDCTAGPAETMEVPALVQPGQHDNVVALALGYGSKLSQRFANIGPPWLEAGPAVGPNGMIGANAAPFLAWKGGTLRRSRLGLRVAKAAGRRPLAVTQTYPNLEAPSAIAPPVPQQGPIVKTLTLAKLVETEAGTEKAHAQREEDLWPDDHALAGHRWGMVIDLNACTGCSACVIACQVENNIPVVGRDEVRRRREMHWLRIDRYYSDRDGEVDVAHQPMLCQHCGKAPCEAVCPVLATVHSEEGLNEQVYNRCVGTRYCANNCPYKVRRFNWFDYAHDDQLQNLVLNPDVTVRSRGVMEKCTFCIQRIELARIEVHRLGRDLIDGDIQTACQQSCPTQAILFGDLHDPKSRVAGRKRCRRAYRALEELNVDPSISYLALVRNREAHKGEQHG